MESFNGNFGDQCSKNLTIEVTTGWPNPDSTETAPGIRYYAEFPGPYGWPPVGMPPLSSGHTDLFPGTHVYPEVMTNDVLQNITWAKNGYLIDEETAECQGGYTRHTKIGIGMVNVDTLQFVAKSRNGNNTRWIMNCRYKKD